MRRTDCGERYDRHRFLENVRYCMPSVQAAHAMRNHVHLAARRYVLLNEVCELLTVFNHGSDRVNLRRKNLVTVISQMAGNAIKVFDWAGEICERAEPQHAVSQNDRVRHYSPRDRLEYLQITFRSITRVESALPFD